MRRYGYIEYDGPNRGSGGVSTKQLERRAMYDSPIEVGVYTDGGARIMLTVYKDGRWTLESRSHGVAALVDIAQGKLP